MKIIRTELENTKNQIEFLELRNRNLEVKFHGMRVVATKMFYSELLLQGPRTLDPRDPTPRSHRSDTATPATKRRCQ